ncbi:uncharacterized protein K452DRAFT_146119 [Aplosporella prunicola CBS 121167]|uniref:Uncharacterized protein n=1 Tax=Aplosporella prunicola CBS 121167 TaxID=1176127 RepID=A0A6A6BKU6_9PEZI|nr:uncharacterized protein K452DRAFT_146119 [Aplosporella prunicola CBS 121167]KAF2144729.1 hypothetical protein K452DRAFT_146119 [Aplosporella prunicola CBS 121167]
MPIPYVHAHARVQGTRLLFLRPPSSIYSSSDSDDVTERKHGVWRFGLRALALDVCKDGLLILCITHALAHLNSNPHPHPHARCDVVHGAYCVLRAYIRVYLYTCG